ncbi:hypothetical protein SDC9_184708 [bioreactor metagenome]|uniref:Uncharacterized protein n=1 Tax=bioreactor metagenome TaxID=1076179 RepID=A0A645HFN0_9ZZZZ
MGPALFPGCTCQHPNPKKEGLVNDENEQSRKQKACKAASGIVESHIISRNGLNKLLSLLSSNSCRVVAFNLN